MFAKTMIALSAALVLGTATTTVAMAKAKGNSNPRAAFAQSGPISVYGPNRVVHYDTSGASVFGWRLTPTCPLSLKQQSRC
jgi:hypothetical protein